MSLYELKNKKLTYIKESTFRIEKDIQDVVEKNLQELFDLEFVTNEFVVGRGRIDTVAWDNESNSFVIIEYKKDKSSSVVDQGYYYLNIMLENKSDFILEYNERKINSLQRSSVDWSQSRIIFISQSFTHYQAGAVNFQDMPFELWEIRRYINNTIRFEQVSASSDSNLQVKSISKNKIIKKVSREIKNYTEEYHLAKGSKRTRKLYDDFKNILPLVIPELKIIPKAKYIAFKAKTNVLDVVIQRSKVKVHLNMKKGTLNDPKNLCRDVSNVGHWGNGDYEMTIDENFDTFYVSLLIEQSYIANVH